MKQAYVDSKVHEGIKNWSEATGLPMASVVMRAVGLFVPPTTVDPVSYPAVKKVWLDDETHKRIKIWSEMTGLTMQAVVRIAVELFVPPTTVEPVPLSIREQAHQGGWQKYQGNPCKRGHDGVRFSSTGQCVACMDARNSTHTVRGEPYEAIAHRAELFKQRETIYVSNVPCPQCHGFNRRVKSGRCADCFSGDGKRIQDVDRGPLPIATPGEMSARLKRASWSI